MAYKWIERAMMLAATSPVVISLLYREWNYLYSILMRGLEVAKGIEEAIRPFGTMIALLGVFGTIVALFVLLFSLRKQDRQHKEQMLQMNENHEEHLNEVRQQFLTQMSQIIADDRENYFTNYIIAAASNIHYHRHLNVSKGFYLFIHDEETQDYFCVIFWNMRYKHILKMDENYIFDLHFKIYSIREIFGHSFNPKNIDNGMISIFVHNDLSNRHNYSPYWDLKISVPRFGNEYGRLATDRDFSGMSRVDIGQMDIYKFACIADAMAEIQVLEESRMIEARNAANHYKL